MKPPTNGKPPRLLTLKPALLSGLLFGTAALAAAQPPDATASAEAQRADRVEARLDTLLRQMTLKEKLEYIHGVAPAPNFPNSTGASIAAIPRLGLPEIRPTDGPQGVRVPDLPSTAHPGSIALGPVGTPSAPGTAAWASPAIAARAAFTSGWDRA